MSEHHHDNFSLTDYVGGADHHAIKNAEEGMGGSQGQAKDQNKGGGLLSKLGWGMLGSAGGFLWKKLGAPVFSKVAAWAEKEFPETTEFLKGLKGRTVTLFKDVAANLEKAPGKIMGEVKAVGEDMKAIKDELGGKVAGVFKSSVSFLSRTKDEVVNAAEHPGAMLSQAKDGVVKAVEHPGALLEEAAHIPGVETVVKAAEGTIGKSIAKAGLKTVLEDIPIAGAAIGTFFAVKRAMGGDWTGAAMEEGAGIASIFPGAGTAVSTGLNVTLAARDIARGDGSTPTPASTPSITSAITPGVTGAVTPPAQTPGQVTPPSSEPTDLNSALAQVQQQAGGATGSLAPVTAAAQGATAVMRSTVTPPNVATTSRTDLPPIPGLTQALAARPDISKGVHLPGHGHAQDNGVALTA